MKEQAGFMAFLLFTFRQDAGLEALMRGQVVVEPFLFFRWFLHSWCHSPAASPSLPLAVERMRKDCPQGRTRLLVTMMAVWNPAGKEEVMAHDLEEIVLAHYPSSRTKRSTR